MAKVNKVENPIIKSSFVHTRLNDQVQQFFFHHCAENHLKIYLDDKRNEKTKQLLAMIENRDQIVQYKQKKHQT